MKDLMKHLIFGMLINLKENIVYNFWLGMIRDAWNDSQIKDMKVVL